MLTVVQVLRYLHFLLIISVNWILKHTFLAQKHNCVGKVRNPTVVTLVIMEKEVFGVFFFAHLSDSSSASEVHLVAIQRPAAGNTHQMRFNPNGI